MKNRFILVGCGDFGRELINWAEDISIEGGCQPFSGFLDKNPDALLEYSYDLPWLGTDEDFVPVQTDRFVISITDPRVRRLVSNKLERKGAQFVNFIHPSAVIARTTTLGKGVIILPHVLVSSDTVIGDFVSINALSSIGHDVRVGSFTVISAHVDLTGFVKVGNSVFFGTGAKVLPKLTIGENSRIGAGAIIVRSVSSNSTMYSMPAKRLHKITR